MTVCARDTSVGRVQRKLEHLEAFWRGQDVSPQSASSIPRNSSFTAGRRHTTAASKPLQGAVVVSPSCTPMHNASPIRIPRTTMAATSRCSQSPKRHPHRHYLKPHRIAGPHYYGLAMDHYIAQKASLTRIKPVTSPSCAPGVRRPSYRELNFESATAYSS